MTHTTNAAETYLFAGMGVDYLLAWVEDSDLKLVDDLVD